MTVLESVQVVESGLQVVDWLDSLSVELGFWIPIVSGIPGSLGPGFRIPQEKNSRILESGYPYMGRLFVLSVNAKKVKRLPGCE